MVGSEKLVEAFDALIDGLKLQAEISKQQHELYMKQFKKIELLLDALLKYHNLVDELSEPH
jgi:hypothetical protein